MVFDSLQITDSIESAATIRTPWTLEKQGSRGSAGTDAGQYLPRYMAEENSLNPDHTMSASDE